jgi:hypothetical protein
MLSEKDEMERVDTAPILALERCINRLESIVETESRLLKEGGRLHFEAMNARKTHALLEFVLAAKGAQQDDLAPLRESARRLRASLAANAELLEKHLRATQEIAMLILAGIRQGESDGTYTVRSFGAREK